jgi:hypothetical protein
MGDRTDAYRVLVERKFGRPKCRWKDNNKMDLQELVLREHGLDFCGSGKRQVVGCCECGDEPSGNFLTS